MSGDNRSRLKRWLESGEAKLYPATFPQRELWEVSPVPPEDASNNICTVTTITGPVSGDLCEKAMAMVVERQEVLRLSILPGNNGPVQLVRKMLKPALFLLDLPDGGGAGIEESIDDLIRIPFDLVAGPLYRVTIIRRSPEKHLLVLVIHHAIADGWTLGVFMTDLWTSYAMLALGVHGALEPVQQSYTDWGAAERALWPPKDIRSRKQFWINQLRGAQLMFRAPGQAPADPGQRGRWVSEFPGEMFEAVRELAGSLGATPFSTMLAAFQLVLSNSTGKSDVLVGSPIAQRGKRAVWDTMGSFAGIVPLRGQIDRDQSFAEHAAITHQMTVECFARAMPFCELVKFLDEPVTPGRNPVFDVRFALQNHPMPEVSTPGMEVDYCTRSTGTARFDLACELTEIGGAMEVVWLFREDMFAPSEVERLHNHFTVALTDICDNPNARLTDIIHCPLP